MRREFRIHPGDHGFALSGHVERARDLGDLRTGLGKAFGHTEVEH